MTSKTAVRKLREIYLDENVVIYLREMNIVTVNEEQQEVRISPVVEGYVIDIDQDFVYLGLPDGSVLRTIPHTTVGMIEMSSVEETFVTEDMPDIDDEVH